MIGQEKERWRDLCERAGNEYDPQKLHELVAEINLLEERTAAPAEYFRD